MSLLPRNRSRPDERHPYHLQDPIRAIMYNESDKRPIGMTDNQYKAFRWALNQIDPCGRASRRARILAQYIMNSGHLVEGCSPTSHPDVERISSLEIALEESRSSCEHYQAQVEILERHLIESDKSPTDITDTHNVR